MAGWTHDLRFAVRRLGREPIYALFVVLTLALGIGANVGVFSVVNGVLIRALPFPDSDRLVAIWGRFLPESGFDFPQFSLSIPELVDYQHENRTMAGVGGWLDDTVTIGGVGEEPERVSSAAVTPSLFDVLRVPPALGRVFGDSDRQTGPEPVVILSYAFWQRRFAGRLDIVGQSVVLNGTSRTIVGVMPRRFEFPAGAVLWTPLVIDPANPGNRQAHSYSAIGRLADKVAFETARQEMDVLMRGWRQRFPAIHTGHYLYLTPLLEDTVGGVKSVLLVVLAATAFLLLIVCANIASLVLARAEGRAREAAIRIALGSGRWRLVRLSLAESALLAMTGGLAGALLAARSRLVVAARRRRGVAAAVRGRDRRTSLDFYGGRLCRGCVPPRRAAGAVDGGHAYVFCAARGHAHLERRRPWLGAANARRDRGRARGHSRRRRRAHASELPTFDLGGRGLSHGPAATRQCVATFARIRRRRARQCVLRLGD